MRADAARADRNGSIRAAARAWEKAGAIDKATLEAIQAAVPDDRARVGPVFRVLLFVFTVFAAHAALGFAWLVVNIPFPGQADLFVAMAIAAGIALAVLTEYQVGARKRAQGGTEAGTSFAALGYLIGAFAWLVFDKLSLPDSTAAVLALAVAAALLSAAAWRWGFPLYAGAAAAAMLAALAYVPGGRLAWILLPVAAAPLLVRLADSERLPPAHRRAATAGLVVGLAGLYVAVHLGSFDLGALELMSRSFTQLGPASKSGTLRTLSILATALVPLAYLAIGLHTRRRAFLLLGLGTAVASFVTLDVYVRIAPPWAVLAVSGAALVALVLVLRRWLDAGPAHERGGFTAEPLFEDLARQRLLEAGAAVVSFTPEARPVSDEPKFAGGGGEFGGGGASGEF